MAEGVSGVSSVSIIDWSTPELYLVGYRLNRVYSIEYRAWSKAKDEVEIRVRGAYTAYTAYTLAQFWARRLTN